MTLEEDAQDTVGEINAAVANEAVPDGGHPGILFGGGGTAEVLIDDCVDRIDRRNDLPGDNFLCGRLTANDGFLVREDDVDLDEERGGGRRRSKGIG